MQCENRFCTYWKKGKCTLRKISLDLQGYCECRAYVGVSQEFLELQRRALLQRYETYPPEGSVLVYEAPNETT